MSAPARDRFLAEFARVNTRLPGADVPWLIRLRSDALERFARTGIPTTHHEDWKYTSMSALERRDFIVPAEGGASDAVAARVAELALEAAVRPGHLLVFLDGRYSAALSTRAPLPSGVTLQSLAAALDHAPDALEPYLCDIHRQTAFGALNTAMMADGAWLHVQRGTAVEEPIHLLFLATQPQAAIHVRNLIVVEPGAQATVIEHYAGIGGMENFTNAVAQIFAADGAFIDHYKLQQEAPQAFHVAGIHAMQTRDSRFASHSVSLGAALARNDITTAFDAEGCEADFNGLYLAGGSQHVDHHTRIDHNRPHGSSREYYRGVLDGASRAVFSGRIVVAPGAQKTDAQQANHNLLLSRDAEVDTRPQLEIYADDVKCAHGATVGQLDEAQLFYLRSRGIDEARARGLLVHAFAHDVVERIRAAALKDRVERILLARLPQEECIGETA